MPTFRYEAVDHLGAFRTGTVEAGTVRQAIDAVRNRGLHVRRVEPRSANTSPGGGEPAGDDAPPGTIPSLPALSEPAVESVAGLLSETVGSGLPLEPALRAAAEDAGRAERRVLIRIADDIAAGVPPGEAFTRVGEALPSALLALILAGLEGGDLARLLGRYLTVSRQRAETRRLLVLGLTYPVVLLAGSGSAVVVALLWIVPQFETIFDDFGTNLPFFTEMVLGLSWFLRTFWWAVMAAIAAVALVFGSYWFVMRRRGIRPLGLPVMDFFLRSADWGRFCGLLGLLVEGRQPLAHAMRLTAAAAGTTGVRSAGLAMADDLESGLTPWEAALPRRMPAPIRQAFRWAGRPDVFAEALAGLAELYSRRSQLTASMAGLFVEPFVLFLVASSVGVIVAALFLPLIQVLNALS